MVNLAAEGEPGVGVVGAGDLSRGANPAGVSLASAGVAGGGADGATSAGTGTSALRSDQALDSRAGPPLFTGIRAYRQIDLSVRDFEDDLGFIVVGYVGPDFGDAGAKRIVFSTLADATVVHDETTPPLSVASTRFAEIGLGHRPVLCSKVYRLNTSTAGVTWYAGYP